MSTLKVNTVLSADTPTVNVTDGLHVTGVSTVTGGINVGTAATIHANGNATFSGIATATTVNTTNIVNATPLTNRNLIINGAMRVAQRGDVSSVTSGYGGADRFKFDRDGATAVTLKQGGASDSPVSEGFSNCQHIDITTADTSMGSTNFNLLTTRLEGYNLQGIQKGTANARELTLSFYIKSTVTGTYIAELVDQTNSARHVNKAYTVSASNTWEKKEITFPADTTGTITSDHNRRLDINWWLGAGSTYNSGTLQTSWGSDTNANRAVGQVNAVNSASNDIMITGVQLEVGSVATPFEHCKYGDELRRCQRYFYKIVGQDSDMAAFGFNYSGSDHYFNIEFPAPMRDYPTYTGSSTDARIFANNIGQDFQLSSMSIVGNMTSSNPNRVTLFVSQGGATAGEGGLLSLQNSEGSLSFSAEL